MVAAAVGIATAVAGMAQADAQRSAGNKAADAQSRSSEAGIAEQSREFDAITKMLSPYNDAATGQNGSLRAQQDLLGLNGADAQQKAIDALQNSPQFDALAKQGEAGILANASATGGLRGGNVQAALGQFRPALLNQLVNQQYERLGGLTSIGQNAAAMQGNAGMHSADAITQLLQSQGAARAGAALSGGAANAGMFGSIGQGLGAYMGYGGRFGFGGGSGFTGDPGHTSVDWGF